MATVADVLQQASQQPWYGAVAAAFKAAPPTVWGVIANIESSLNPNASGDCVNGTDAKGNPVYGPCGPNSQSGPTSIGLFQLHQQGGQGTGYSADYLANPTNNAAIAAQSIDAAYQKAVAQGFTGAELVYQTAVMSGHPFTREQVYAYFPGSKTPSQVPFWQKWLMDFYGPGGANTGGVSIPSLSPAQINAQHKGGLEQLLIDRAQAANLGLVALFTHPGEFIAFAATELVGIAFAMVLFGIGGYIVFVNSSAPQVADAIKEPIQKVQNAVTERQAARQKTQKVQEPLRLKVADFKTLGKPARDVATKAHTEGGTEGASRALTNLLGRKVVVE